MIKKLFWLLGMAFYLTACFIFAEQTTIKSRLNPSMDYSLYKTFYLHQVPKANHKEATENLLPQEKHLLKQLKQGLISRGYYLALNSEEADFWGVMNYSDTYNLKHKSLKDDPTFQRSSHSFYEEITRVGGNNYSQPHLEVLFYNPKNGEQLWYAFGYSDGISVNLVDWGSRVIDKMLIKYPFCEDYGGIGITVDHNLRILKVFEGSPSHQQGLRPNDTITQINGVKISTYEQGVNMLAGKSYTTVSITVIRQLPSVDNEDEMGEKFTYQVKRWPVNKFYTWGSQRINNKRNTAERP